MLQAQVISACICTQLICLYINMCMCVFMLYACMFIECLRMFFFFQVSIYLYLPFSLPLRLSDFDYILLHSQMQHECDSCVYTISTNPAQKLPTVDESTSEYRFDSARLRMFP